MLVQCSVYVDGAELRGRVLEARARDEAEQSHTVSRALSIERV